METTRTIKIIVILCLVLTRGLIYGMLIPFDRSPDEYHHFALIKNKQLDLENASKDEIRQTAAKIGLIRYYLLHLHPEIEKTRSLPTFIVDKVGECPSSFDIYYLSTAFFLRIFSLQSLLDEIYLIRGISILCGIIVVLLSFLVVQELFPDNDFLLIGVPLFITFIPQFSAMNGAINNDKFAEVFVSILFLIIVKIFKNGINNLYLLLYIVIMGFALLSKRTAVFTLPLSLMILLIYYWKGAIGFKTNLIILSLFIGLSAGVYLVHPKTIFYRELLSKNALNFYRHYFTLMYWSFWGVFGYMNIHLHHFWYTMAAFFQSISIVGLFKFAFLLKMKKFFVEEWKLKVLYLFALSIILVIIVAFIRCIVFRPGDHRLTQGRRLFPVLIPISILTIFGVEILFPPKYLRFVGMFGTIGLLVLDAVCISNYILLNYYHISFF